MKNIKLNDGRTTKILNVVKRYPEGLMTRKQWLNYWRVKGATVEKKVVPAIGYNRTKYNRMTGDEQEAYEKRLNEKKISYRLNMANSSSFYEISKTEYYYFNILQLDEDTATEKNNLNEKIEAGIATDREINEAMRKEFEFAAKYF